MTILVTGGAGYLPLVPVLADVADRPRMEMLLRRKGFAVVGSMENPPPNPWADLNSGQKCSSWS
ncbi:MAG: hypothetical protein QE276_00015 [Cyanobium sp. D14.bin.5]|jgi:hypothetical protein|nr:hypothetical protein [Cyanobium sp. D14.bin.5]